MALSETKGIVKIISISLSCIIISPEHVTSVSRGELVSGAAPSPLYVTTPPRGLPPLPSPPLFNSPLRDHWGLVPKVLQALLTQSTDAANSHNSGSGS
jgi:hypothetical protein